MHQFNVTCNTATYRNLQVRHCCCIISIYGPLWQCTCCTLQVITCKLRHLHVCIDISIIMVHPVDKLATYGWLLLSETLQGCT